MMIIVDNEQNFLHFSYINAYIDHTHVDSFPKQWLAFQKSPAMFGVLCRSSVDFTSLRMPLPQRAPSSSRRALKP